MSVRNWPRLLIAIVISLVLAVLLALQSLSSVLTKKNPELAVELFPANGLAREQLAFRQFSAGLNDPADAPEVARQAAPVALEAYRDVALAPKALTILALASDDGNRRKAILDLAHQLNRRDLSLLGSVLQERLLEEDYAGTIQTLDQILRVHPEYSREFFPVLSQALSDNDTIPLFANMLNGSAPWHEQFLIHAVRQPELASNLAILRNDVDVGGESFDRLLVARLAGNGEIDTASALVKRIGGGAGAGAAYVMGTLDWRSTYPPFEWQFEDEPGFRAQASTDLSKLELSVRPGKGGVIAARMIEVPEDGFAVRVKHRIAPADQLRDVRLQLVCVETTAQFFDERLSNQGEQFEINSVPAGCQNMVLAINARAWSGRSALSGTIDQIEIVPAN